MINEQKIFSDLESALSQFKLLAKEAGKNIDPQYMAFVSSRNNIESVTDSLYKLACLCEKDLAQLKYQNISDAPKLKLLLNNLQGLSYGFSQSEPRWTSNYTAMSKSLNIMYDLRLKIETEYGLEP